MGQDRRGVGAAAVLFRNERSRGCEEVPGKGRHHTVFEAKLMGLELVRMEGYMD